MMTRFLLSAAVLIVACGCCTHVWAAPAFQWSDLYDGGAQYVDYGTTALIDSNGDLYVGGECNDSEAGSDMLIRKIDRESAETLWTTSYSAFDGNDMALTGIVQDGEGKILVGGYIRGCDT